MTRRLLIAAALGAALLAGCQAPSMHGADHERTCNEPVCQVKIDVSNGFITVDPEILHVTGPNRMIHWVLQNGQYEFKADGIAFYDRKSSSQFSEPGPKENGAQFQWRDRNSTRADPPWAYQIKVYKRNSSEAPLTRDPAIVNDG
jgi:hypothetical protein